MTRILLIGEHLPSENHGVGQRVNLWKKAAEKVGEHRFLHLLRSPDQASQADYTAPATLMTGAGSWQIRLWQASMGHFRPGAAYKPVLHRIHREFPFDVALCMSFRSAPAAPLDLAPCILDTDDLPWPQGTFTRWLWPATRRAMQRRYRHFARTVVISQPEGDLLASDGLQPDLLPGAVARIGRALSPEQPRGRNVLFIGSPVWPPNREAAQWLLAIGLPARLAAAGYQLRIVGAGTEALPDTPGLSRGGFVDDIADEYAQAALVLCPIEHGGGANIKLAEAVQYGSAMLASHHAATRYKNVLVPGRDIETYRRGPGFVDDVLRLLADEARLVALRRAAQTVSRTVLAPDRLTDRMADWIREAAGAGPRP